MFLTYELRENGSGVRYYRITRRLAGYLQEQILDLEEELSAFSEYIARSGLEPVRQRVEYAIELLDFAVLHRWIHRGEAEVEYDLGDTTFAEISTSVDFMKKSGEFREEILRFQNWVKFWEEYPQNRWKVLWRKVKSLVDLVDEWGDRYLEQYISQLDSYREEHKRAWEEREDAGLILRDKSCYYINMIAAQILNRCFRDEFLECDRVYIFLPGCMAAKMDNCMAAEEKDGYVCRSCSENCQVNHLSKKYPDVRIVYHGSQMEGKSIDSQKSTGVVGVACILNLISGGWKAKRLGYVPQCVILNECGCGIHWSRQGIVTSLEEEELEHILGQE